MSFWYEKKPATLTLLIVLYKFASIVNFFKNIYIYIYREREIERERERDLDREHHNILLLRVSRSNYASGKTAECLAIEMVSSNA